MSNNKSPGPDGLCVEFYKMYWKDIKHDLFECFMEGLQHQKLSYSQYLAVITLLYKKGIREDIKNWRPISLLNVDFKILSKTLSERLKKVMSGIIHTDQRGCISGHYIGENIRLVEDILQSKDDDSVILLLDQEKAFDRVEWPWLYKVLTAFNFGETFISWIKLLYQYAQTSILTNGIQSEYFKITRGIRQGDAMSALLYIIQTEPLAQKLRTSTDIEGVKIGNNGHISEVRVSQYVDDANVFLKNSTFIEPCLRIIDEFELVSGSKLNKHKTKGLVVNPENNQRNVGGIVLTTGPEMVLGVPLGKSKHCDEFWKKLIEKLKSKLNVWNMRDLSIEGKIHVVKSLGLSTMLYAIEMKEIKSSFVSEVIKLLWNFLWSGKKYTVKREICVLPRYLGGIGMVDFQTIIKVKRIKWVINILKGHTSDTWKILPLSYLKCLDKDFDIDFFALRVKDSTELIHKSHIPLFYKECILSFQELCRKGMVVNCMEDEILWCNNSLQFNGSPLTFKHWSKCGVKYISDAVTRNEIDEHRIKNCLVHKASFFFDFHKFKSCFPSKWRDGEMKEKPYFNGKDSVLNFNFQIPGSKIKHLQDLSSKEIYHILLLNNKVSTNSKAYWSAKFPQEQIEWKEWYKNNFVNKLLPRKCKDFNWKIFYGQVNTECRLMKMNYSDGICKICSKTIENVEHMFLDCSDNVRVWTVVENLVQNIINGFKISRLYILCGYFEKSIYSELVNVFISICRWNLWKRRNNNKYENVLMNVDEFVKLLRREFKMHIDLILKHDKGNKHVLTICKYLIGNEILVS